jgi:DNA-binding transcriptional MerR regulator
LTKKQYSITELSREFHITTRALRFYEAQGLLTPLRKGTTRIYSPRDRTRVKLALRGKRLGFSLEEIKDILEMYDSDPGELGQLEFLMKRISEQCGVLEEKRRDINKTLEELHLVSAKCLQRMQLIAGQERIESKEVG